jgi:hypothetical protein
MKNLKTLLFAAIFFALADSVNAQSVGAKADVSLPASGLFADQTDHTPGFYFITVRNGQLFLRLQFLTNYPN